MSRAGNLVGKFYTEGSGPLPWTAQDEDRLHGRFTIGGRPTRPHVDTPSGPFIIGAVPLPPRAKMSTCEDCKAQRVRRTDKAADVYGCSNCGAEYSWQYLISRGLAAR